MTRQTDPLDRGEPSLTLSQVTCSCIVLPRQAARGSTQVKRVRGSWGCYTTRSWPRTYCPRSPAVHNIHSKPNPSPRAERHRGTLLSSGTQTSGSTTAHSLLVGGCARPDGAPPVLLLCPPTREACPNNRAIARQMDECRSGLTRALHPLPCGSGVAHHPRLQVRGTSPPRQLPAGGPTPIVLHQPGASMSGPPPTQGKRSGLPPSPGVGRVARKGTMTRRHVARF